MGVEIDERRARTATRPPNGRIVNECAFQHRGTNYDACVGNPPYVRHNYIESDWKAAVLKRIQSELGIKLGGNSNLYLYFVCLGLLKTNAKGLLSFLIPYEWVSRPSARGVREHIQDHKWNVHVYRFRMPIFPEVLTTASISIIDKARSDGEWGYYDIDSNYNVSERSGVVASKRGIFRYEDRGKIWALRGLSPGSQKIFTLTEGERIHFGLDKRDVTPCITTLRRLPARIRTLSKRTFKKHFIEAGERCWLIKSYKSNRSAALNAYLATVPISKRSNYTCKNQDPWFNFQPHPIPQIIVAAGFVQFGPKVLLNSVRATAVGSAWGIHSKAALPLRRLQQYLLNINFEDRVVAHARVLKKIEVSQFNTALRTFSRTLKL